MKHFLLPVAAMAFGLTVVAQDLPQASPYGEVEQVVGLTKVEIDYSRPNVRGRQIFGDLLPFGKIWRLGANSSTTIELDGPVMIDGQKLAKGKYSMLAIPNEGAWEIIFNKNPELWGTNRKEDEDALHIKAETAPSDFTETLTITFDEVKDDKARVDIRWEKTRASFWISADATEQGMENIKKALAEKDPKAGAYASSARFAMERGVMTKEALGWAQKAVDMDAKYYYMHTLALVQAANGLTKEAIATAEKSMDAAKKADDMAYVKLNEAKLKEWKGK
ncbi:MAG: DUF2911 domain-containing protein [Flavobacteriales bacterium]|nr:DUF2911 domain-containing protein [Flavobacteriales bacterium]